VPGSLSVRKARAAQAKKDALAVKRRNQERALENPKALASGVASIPRRVVNYIRTSTPSGVAGDIASVARSTYEAAKEDPGQFAADAVFSPLAAIRDFGDLRARARELRAAGRENEAQKLEAMTGAVLASAIPIVGRAPAAAVRAAERGALQGAERAVVRDFSKVSMDPSLYGLRKTMDLPRLQASPVKTEQFRVVPQPSKVSLGDYEGRPFIISMADRSAAGDRITAIGNQELNLPVDLQGGQDFMFAPTAEDLVWASEASPVSNIMNLARQLYETTGEKPLYLPFRMGGEGSDFATMTGETMMSYADAAFGKSDKAAMNRLIKKYIPDFAGISEPKGYEQFADLSGAKRKQLQLDLSNTFGEEGGGLTLPMTRAMIADPAQLDKPSFFLQNVGEIDPTADIVTSTGHRTYSRGVPGRGLGVLGDDVNVAQLLPELSKIYQIGDPRQFRGQYADFTDYGRQLKIAEEAAMREKSLRQGKTPKVYNTERGGTSKYMQSGAKFGVLTPELLRLLEGE
jgi:hypothetical protein